jgi:uncharacterized surface protein with fasciclin (FAS1) repeats
MNKTIMILVLLGVVGAVAYLMTRPMPQESVTQSPTPTETNTTEATEGATMNQTIVEIAAANPNFSTLVTAVTEAGLVETLSGEGPFTVFAPTNEAFAKLPAGTLESLLADKAALTKVLTYHVVPGKVMAADVVGLTSATTVQGQDVTVAVEGESVMINNSTVVATDIEASNGVIHVIDTVLLPR